MVLDFIEILKVIFLGIVEGITEWLPISSTGHMIGNLFDNAIEASLKLPPDQRMIRIYMDMKNTQLYISFTNLTAEKKLQKSGRIFHSTKGEGHGLGLVRIDASIDRLGGYLSRNSENGAFTTEILLPQQ